jgi:hypothetical protein
MLFFTSEDHTSTHVVLLYFVTDTVNSKACFFFCCSQVQRRVNDAGMLQPASLGWSSEGRLLPAQQPGFLR